MKKRIVYLTVLFAVFAFAIFTGAPKALAAEKVIKAGFCPGPYASLFYAAIKPGLEAKGYRIEFKEYPDYVQPNLALSSGEIDLNMFQHLVYLENFKKQRGIDLTAIAFIPTISMGIYSKTVPSLNEVPSGAKIAIPSDPTNKARAFRLMKTARLLIMDAQANPAQYSEDDIQDNPHNLKIISVDAAKTADELDNVALAAINGNFAIFAGLDIARVLFSEVLAKDFINVIAIRTSAVNSQMHKDLLDVLKSPEYKRITEDPKRIYSSFQKPSYQLF